MLIRTIKNLFNHPLSQSQKIIVLTRFIKWQLRCRLISREVLFNWIGNAKLVGRLGENAVTGNVYHGLFEFSDMAFLLHSLRKEDVFVDIGANAGTYTVLSSAVIGAQSYSFEPIPATFARLMTNVRVNNIGHRVNAFNKALGDEVGELLFSSDKDAMNHVVINKSPINNQSGENSIPLEVSTLDAELKDVTPFLMKIDVEGYEASVLYGALNTLKDNNLCAIIMELDGAGSRYGFAEKDIIDTMFQLNFKPYSYNPFNRTLTALSSKNTKEVNTIFIRDFDRVMDRINQAPKFKVSGHCI